MEDKKAILSHLAYIDETTVQLDGEQEADAKKLANKSQQCTDDDRVDAPDFARRALANLPRSQPHSTNDHFGT